MRTPTARRSSTRYFTVITFIAAVAAFIAVLALPLTSAKSGSAARRSEANKSHTVKNWLRMPGAGLWGHTAMAPTPVAETITTYSADCLTPKDTFIIGETVCAKTDSVAASELTATPGRWVDWILTDNSNAIVSGSRTTTKITSNPQSFTYTPTATGVYKAEITQDSTGNPGQDDPQTPADFTVVAEPTLATYNAACTISKTDFTLGETVCVKVNTSPGTNHTLSFADPAVLVENTVGITNSPQTATFILPTATTQTRSIYSPALTFDNRGTWQLFLKDEDGQNEDSTAIIVHDPQTNIADLEITKSPVINSIVTAGGQMQTVVWVFNYGPDTAQNVQVSDSTPSNTTFASLAQTFGPTFNCTTPSVGSAGASNCTRSSLKNGEAAGFVATYNVNSNIGNGSNLTGTASATTTTTERTTDDNSSSSTATGSNPAPPACTLSCPANITTTAPLGETSAIVNFSAPTTSGTCGSVSSTPASGSSFGIGSTVVTASTENGESCSFVVTVNPADDHEAPVITCPSDITVDETSPSANSAPVTFSVTATDNSGSANVSCDPPSGSSFATGTHQVTCTATDGSNNSSSCSFNVTVNNVGCDLDANSPPPTPNVANLPTITGACSVTLLAADDPTATDACSAIISGDTTDDRTYDSPGTYTVHWTYTDSAGHTSTQNQTIIIQPDNSAPVPDAANLSSVTGECEVASINAPTATDNCAGTVTGTTANLPVVGAGTHTIVWNYDDGRGNVSHQNQTVIITDTHAPTVALVGASSITVECHTSFNDPGVTTTDNCVPKNVTVNTTGSPDVNVPGTYTVTYTATDGGGNTASVQRTVIVQDTIKPVITGNGGNMTVECHTSFTDPGASASDSCDSNVPVVTSGSVNVNVPGTYTLTYNASDDSGNAADSVTRTVTVVDTTAPVITLTGFEPLLWPPNHKYTTFQLSQFVSGASDSCDTPLGLSRVVIEKVTSDETENGGGDGNTLNDIVIGADCKSVQLRAERNGGGNGRVYTITFKATDASGNVGRATAKVRVPQNNGGTIVEDAVQYTVNGTCP